MIAFLVDLGWKSAAIAGLALLASHLLRRRPPGERVALLRSALAVLLMLPALAFAVPELELAILPALEAPSGAMLAMSDVGAVDAVTADAPATTILDWLPALYWIVATLLLLRLAIGLFTLWRWTRMAAPVRDPRWTAALRAVRLRRPVRLLVSPRIAAPVSWGLSPAWVLIGPATERRGEQADAVIAHELAHVRRFDWPVLMAAQLARLCFWFNPLVWLLARELARQTELAADEEAVHYVARADYAQTLLALAGGTAHPAACGMSITHNALGRRICCVLDGDAARPASRLVCAAILACAPLAAAPLAAMQFVRAPAVPVVPETALAARPATSAVRTQPAIIPAANAAARPMAQRPRSIPRRVAPTQVSPPEDTSDAGLAAPLQDPPIQFVPRHAGHTPPPPRPPAPGTEAAEWQEALSKANVQAETRPRNMRMRRAEAETGTLDRDARALVRELTTAARGLRVKAQDLEAVAANGAVAREIRGAHARAASSLRNQADRLDMEARRKLGG